MMIDDSDDPLVCMYENHLNMYMYFFFSRPQPTGVHSRCIMKAF